MELPPLSSVMFYWGVQPVWTTDKMKGLCCSIPSLPLLILWCWTASRWLSEQPLRYCSLLHKHSCYDSSPWSLSIKVSTSLAISPPQAIWCRTGTLSWIEPAQLNVTLIAFNCLNSTLPSLFNPHPTNTFRIQGLPTGVPGDPKNKLLWEKKHQIKMFNYFFLKFLFISGYVVTII